MMKKSSNGNDKTSFNDGDYPTALVLSILTSLATVPYLLFILFTLCSKALLRPKNIFKSNFASSAIIHLVSEVGESLRPRAYENT